MMRSGRALARWVSPHFPFRFEAQPASAALVRGVVASIPFRMRMARDRTDGSSNE